MIEARSIGDIAALTALRDAWHGLWQRCRATPFQHPGFALAWWAAFHPGTLAATAFFRQATLVALAPLYRETGSGRLLILGMAIISICSRKTTPKRKRPSGAPCPPSGRR